MSEPEHWSCRNVAEFAYCPRLFYYMQVEGVFLPSADTEQGNYTHRRVDRPSAEPDPGKPQTVRSLTLSSDRLELTAVLDLCELDGMRATPVEYRKGRPCRSVLQPPPEDADEAEEPPITGPEPWPTDRVQVALQALLLEEAGYEVRECVLYYAAEKLRLRLPLTDELRTEALSVLEAAKLCALGTRPPPLVNDPKCPRCSLQPLCLPDEVNFESDEESAVSPRRIWPPCEDGIQVVALQDATRIGVRGHSLRVTDKDGVLVSELPLAGVESLTVVGNVQVSTQAIGVLADRLIPVAWLSAAGRLKAMLDPLDSTSAHVRACQVRRFDDETARLELGRALILAKVANQRTMLMRNHPDLPADVPSELARLIRQAGTAETLDSLRGYEGQAAAVYFRHFAGLFSGDPAREFDENGRKRRPPPDPVNACISMGYSMLAHECTAALRTARLEPSIGAFHSSRPGRPALALDLMEPFRPLIADSVAVSTFNREELTSGHFARTAAGCALTDAGRKAFFRAWARRMNEVVTHPEFGYRLSYRRMLILHARLIAAWVTGDVKSLAFLTTR